MNVFTVVVAPASFAQPGIAATISEVQQQSLGTSTSTGEYATPTKRNQASDSGYVETSVSGIHKQEEEEGNHHQTIDVDYYGDFLGTRRGSSRRRSLSRGKQSCNFSMIRELLFDENYMDISHGCLGTRVYDSPQAIPPRKKEENGSPMEFQHSFDGERSSPIHLSTQVPSPKRGRSIQKTALISPTSSPGNGVSNFKQRGTTISSSDDDSRSGESIYSSAFICSYDSCCSFERVYDTFVQWCDDSPCCGKTSTLGTSKGNNCVKVKYSV